MARAVRISVLVLAVGLLGTAAVKAVCPPGDLSSDCEVDFDDIRLFAQQWLIESGCTDSNCADMDGVDGVNMFDFALLTRTWFERGHPIVINEIMASNTKFVQDPQDEYDDWLELYNAGDEAFDVAGMYVTDNLSKPTKWRIPTDAPLLTTIEAHSHLWIWADKDVMDSPGLHADFDFPLNADKLVKATFFPSIFLKDRPVLDKINQAVFTLTNSQAHHKNYLLPQSAHHFKGHRKVTYLLKIY